MSYSPLSFLSDRGQVVYDGTLAGKVTVEELRAALDDQTSMFTRLDALWLKRTLAVIEDDTTSLMLVLAEMLVCADPFMSELALIELSSRGMGDRLEIWLSSEQALSDIAETLSKLHGEVGTSGAAVTLLEEWLIHARLSVGMVLTLMRLKSGTNDEDGMLDELLQLPHLEYGDLIQTTSTFIPRVQRQ